jgi:hypothetical protein
MVSMKTTPWRVSTVQGKPQSPGHASSCGSLRGCASSVGVVTVCGTKPRNHSGAVEVGLEHALSKHGWEITRTVGSILAWGPPVKLMILGGAMSGTGRHLQSFAQTCSYSTNVLG